MATKKSHSFKKIKRGTPNTGKAAEIFSYPTVKSMDGFGIETPEMYERNWKKGKKEKCSAYPIEKSDIY